MNEYLKLAIAAGTILIVCFPVAIFTRDRLAEWILTLLSYAAVGAIVVSMLKWAMS